MLGRTWRTPVNLLACIAALSLRAGLDRPFSVTPALATSSAIKHRTCIATSTEDHRGQNHTILTAQVAHNCQSLAVASPPGQGSLDVDRGLYWLPATMDRHRADVPTSAAVMP